MRFPNVVVVLNELTDGPFELVADAERVVINSRIEFAAATDVVRPQIAFIQHAITVGLQPFLNAQSKATAESQHLRAFIDQWFGLERDRMLGKRLGEFA